MSIYETDDGMRWQPTWTQAMTDFRGEEDEPPFDDVTVRMTVPAGLGGSHVRAELSNRFGDDAVRIGHGSITVGDRSRDVTVGEERSVEVPAGESLWTDPIELPVRHGDDVVVDIYLPEPTPYATAAGFKFARSTPGDFAGSRAFPLAGSAPQAVDEAREFPAANTDGRGWSLPAGGPFLRTIEVAGAGARAVIVALGASSTAMGWPQYTAALLPTGARIAVVNRGIPGNRIRLDAPASRPSWGRAGLTRFDDDVLATSGVTHVVIAYNNNDWGLPGRVTSPDEMPTAAQVIAAYGELVERAQDAGLGVVLATVTPLAPELLADPDREAIRRAVNDWIRTSGHDVVDFDAAIRAESDPSRLAPAYAAPDDTHPSVAGQKRLAEAMLAVIDRIVTP